MSKIYLLVCAFFLCFITSMKAQTNQLSPNIVTKQFGRSIASSQELTPSGHIRCQSTEYETYLKQQYPERATTSEFEAWLAPKINEYKRQVSNGTLSRATVLTIPVVVHVIHNGDALGTGENINDNQVLSQIRVLNEDFRRMIGTPGYNTNPVGADIEIEFCMAQTDPSGNTTNGINRVNAGVVSYDSMAATNTMKTTTIWDPTQYLNMWSVRFGGGMAGTLGFAQFPDSSGLAGLNASGGAANTDGVVSSFDAFGSQVYAAGSYNPTYNLGRTMTHEVGHWMGLRHIWGDGNCSVDDFCADTPDAAAANFNCVTTNSCATAGNDMIENYMDYTNDACMNIFTEDQKTRIRTVFSVSPRRSSLASSTKCQAPAPFIQFGNTTGSVLEDTNCNYVDISYPITIARAATAIANVTFSVTGGTATQNVDYQIVNPSVTFPAGTTAAQNLVVRFFNDGIVEANETIIIDLLLNANGGNALLNNTAKTITITIQNNDFAPTATEVVSLLSEDFEDLTGWTVLDADLDGNNWGRVTGLDGVGTAPNTISGATGFSAKRLNYFGSNSTVSPNNYLISPQITIPAGATNVDFSYILGAFDNGGPVRNAGDIIVYFSPNIINQTAIQSGTVIQTALVINENTTQLRTYNLNALAGQTGYIVFRHVNATAGNVGLLLIDTVQLNATISTQVQTETNLATAYSALLKSSGTMYATDTATNKIMSGISTTSGFDYGCTSIYVDRSATSVGNATAAFTDAIAANAVMSKTYRITSQNDTAAGSYTISFYYTEAEVAAWEAATGRSRNDLHVIKVANNPISAVNPANFTTFGIEAQPVTLSSFGTSVVFQAPFSSPLSGGYTLGIESIINCGDVVTTWNGTTWSNGIPYTKIVAIINGDYDTATNGSFSCCSLTVNTTRTVSVGANTNITVTGDITVAGTLNVLNDGSLVQIDDAAINTGNISYERTVSIRKNDYVYWSSPISDFSTTAISPLTTSNYILNWNPTIVNSNGGLGNWVSAAGEIMVPGKGYIVKGPDNFTNTAQDFTATFSNGIPNNGIITVPVSRGGFTGTSYNGTNGSQITQYSDNWNLVGNPYPSAILALDFLNLNTNIEGAIRLWTHTNLPSTAVSSSFYGNASSNYTPADYITYNGLGTVSGPLGFNGYIAGGQGFFVQMNDGAAATQDITFNNSLRSAAYANNQFYRSAAGVQTSNTIASRIWLDIIDSSNNSDRTLVGYTEGATTGKDRLFDAVTAAAHSLKIYSLLESDFLTIQGKPYPIDVNDKVAIGINVMNEGSYSIAIAAVEGISAELPIYLEDKMLSVIHDLRQTPYFFTATSDQTNNRFVLRYNNQTLGNEDFITDSAISVATSDVITVFSTTELIQDVKVFNMLGQSLINEKEINATTFEITTLQKNKVPLLIQATLQNGVITTKKVIF